MKKLRTTGSATLPLLLGSVLGIGVAGCAEPRGSPEPVTETSPATSATGTASNGSAGDAGPGADGSSTVASGNTAGTGGHGQTGGGTTELPRQYHYLRNETFTKLVIEVDYVAGREPTPSVQDAIIAGFAPILEKQDGIEIVLDDVLAPGGEDHAWTHAELDALAAERFDLQVDEEAIKMHALFVDGHYAPDDEPDGGTTFGVAWGKKNHVLFQDVIEQSCAVPLLRIQQPICEATVRNVWVHEIGHVVGLVDAGLPMVQPHRDPEHGVHDIDPECVMYWSVNTAGLVDDLVERELAGEDLHLGFDEACLADIESAKVVDP